LQSPGKVKGALMNRQDFQILLEGAGSPSDASTRDVGYGVAVSALTTAVSLCPSVEGDKNGGPIKLFIVMSCAAVAAFVVAILFHARTRTDKGRQSYREVVERFRAHLDMKDP